MVGMLMLSRKRGGQGQDEGGLGEPWSCGEEGGQIRAGVGVWRLDSALCRLAPSPPEHSS